MEFSMKDSYRNMVEAASGGKNTVMYDDFGNPNIMVCIPAYNCRCIGSTQDYVHPAFMVEGKEVSEIWIGKYPGSWGNGGVAVSLPRMDPIMGNFDNQKAREICMKKGEGWHLFTNVEWAAVMIQAASLGRVIEGCGMDKLTGKVYGGVPADNALPDLPVVKTGTGPVEWTHDGTQYGIYDLVGYMWEHLDGFLFNIRTGSIRTHGIDDHICNMPFSNKYNHVGICYDQSTADYKNDNSWGLDTSDEFGDGACENGFTRILTDFSKNVQINEPNIRSRAPGCELCALTPMREGFNGKLKDFKGQLTPYTDYNKVSLQRNIKRKDDCWVDIRRGGRVCASGVAYPGMFSMGTNDSLDPEQKPNQIGDLTAPRPCWVEYSRKYGE